MQLLILALLGSLVQTGGARPDFSGVWEADLGASQTGGLSYSRMALDVAHAEPKLVLKTEAAGDFGTFTAELSCTTDGSPCTGKEATGTAAWDGAALVVTRQSNAGGMTVSIKERWTLAADRASLTMDREVSADAGGASQKIVYRRAKK